MAVEVTGQLLDAAAAVAAAVMLELGQDIGYSDEIGDT